MTSYPDAEFDTDDKVTVDTDELDFHTRKAMVDMSAPLHLVKYTIHQVVKMHDRGSDEEAYWYVISRVDYEDDETWTYKNHGLFVVPQSALTTANPIEVGDQVIMRTAVKRKNAIVYNVESVFAYGFDIEDTHATVSYSTKTGELKFDVKELKDLVAY